jgi:hypothetical protein
MKVTRTQEITTPAPTKKKKKKIPTKDLKESKSNIYESTENLENIL